MTTHIAVWIAGAAFGVCFGALWMEHRINKLNKQNPKKGDRNNGI